MSSSLQGINSILKQLQSNIQKLNKAKQQLTKKQKAKAIQVPKADKKKILKLFRYSSWQQFMKWTNQKLAQSGQIDSDPKQSQVQNEKQRQIEPSQLKSNLKSTQCNAEFEDTLNFSLTEESHELRKSFSSSKYQGQKRNLFHDIQIDKKQQQDDQQLQLIALQNGRLRRQNIILKNKLIELHAAISQ